MKKDTKLDIGTKLIMALHDTRKLSAEKALPILDGLIFVTNKEVERRRKELEKNKK